MGWVAPCWSGRGVEASSSRGEGAVSGSGIRTSLCAPHVTSILLRPRGGSDHRSVSLERSRGEQGSPPHARHDHDQRRAESSRFRENRVPDAGGGAYDGRPRGSREEDKRLGPLQEVGEKCVSVLRSLGGVADLARLVERWTSLHPRDEFSRDGQVNLPLSPFCFQRLLLCFRNMLLLPLLATNLTMYHCHDQSVYCGDVSVNLQDAMLDSGNVMSYRDQSRPSVRLYGMCTNPFLDTLPLPIGLSVCFLCVHFASVPHRRSWPCAWRSPSLDETPYVASFDWVCGYSAGIWGESACDTIRSRVGGQRRTHTAHSAGRLEGPFKPSTRRSSPIDAEPLASGGTEGERTGTRSRVGGWQSRGGAWRKTARL